MNASGACRILSSVGAAMVLTHCETSRPRVVTNSTDHAKTASAISRAVTYLWRNQATAETERSSQRASFEGDWDQFLSIHFGPVRLSMHDTSPFIPAYVCQGIGQVSAENAVALGVSDEDCARAREICSRVARLVQRFELGDGTVAYWPLATAAPAGLRDQVRASVIRGLIRGPALRGTLAPRGASEYPPEFRIWPDPDCTAMSWVARCIDARAHGTQWRHGDPLQVLAAHAYTGKEKLYFPVAIIPPPGVYHGFCVPKNHPEIPRDVDLIVNGNILYALALLGVGDSRAAGRIFQWIVETVQSGRHRNLDDITLYYRWENMLPYVVARCYRDGGITNLAPTVKTLATEIRANAIQSRDGTVHWEGSSPVRATAFGLLALINSGDRGPLIEGAVRYLLANQDARSGCWHDRWVPLRPTMTGRTLYLRSDAAATAFAIEALCRYQIDVRQERSR